MGRDLNQITILGNVGNDAEIKTFDNGGQIANFSVATTESWKDKAGEWQNITTWHRVVVKNKFLVEKAQRAVVKGARVLVQGQSLTRSFTTSDGTEKFITELVVPMFAGLVEVQPNGKDQESDGQSQTSDGFDDGLDDEIPFS